MVAVIYLETVALIRTVRQAFVFVVNVQIRASMRLRVRAR
ncbi:MAG: hypothetical protein BWX66_01847 [Deltaproteobacteria bacterium ADurb.Bin058]|nr:MAG: hypothetical protein BWX66_01847 [Deltaproteobacteria bacterium ADurb.Bin058]